MAMCTTAVVAPTQIVMDDIHGLNTLQYQPAKVAAMEGLSNTTSGAPLALFGISNMGTERLDYAIEVPRARCRPVAREHLSGSLCALRLFALCFAGLGISMSPLMVLPSIDIRQPAAPYDSQLSFSQPVDRLA